MKKLSVIALVLLAIVLSSCGSAAPTAAPTYTTIETTLEQDGFSIDPNLSCSSINKWCDKVYINSKLKTGATVFNDGTLGLTITVDPVNGKTDPTNQINSIDKILHKLYPSEVVARVDKYLADMYTPDNQVPAYNRVVSVVGNYNTMNDPSSGMQIDISIYPFDKP